MTNDATHAYVGRRECGCMCAAILDFPGNEAETGKEVAEFIRDGMKIDRVTVEDVRANYAKDCAKCRKPVTDSVLR
jgi:hypothetical protein